jgi:hypothetical protein
MDRAHPENTNTELPSLDTGIRGETWEGESMGREVCSLRQALLERVEAL